MGFMDFMGFTWYNFTLKDMNLINHMLFGILFHIDFLNKIYDDTHFWINHKVLFNTLILTSSFFNQVIFFDYDLMCR